MYIYTLRSIIRSILITFFILISTVIFSQEDKSIKEDTLKLKDIMPVNTITVGLGRAYDIFSGDPFSNIGFDYLRRFHEKWEVGLQLDIDWKKNFTHFEGVQVAAIAVYSITNKWPVFAGFGIEGTEEHRIGFLRVGTEYTFFVGKKGMFFLAPGSFIDMNTESVTPSVMFAVGVNW